MRIFQVGETVEIYAEIKDRDGNFAEPGTSIKITITSPADAAAVTNLDMSQLNSETGKYVYYYNLPSYATLGWWAVQVTLLDGTKYTKTRGGFKVEA